MEWLGDATSAAAGGGERRPGDAGALDELGRYSSIELSPRGSDGTQLDPVLLHRFVLADDGGELSLFSTVTTFGTANDITLAELSIEAFYPADSATRAALRAHAEQRDDRAHASAR